MEISFESKVGKVKTNEVLIYSFLSDFNNLKQFVPSDKAFDFESDTDSCRFSVPNMGKVGLRIIEREPYKTIKITGDGMANQQFFLWAQFKKLTDNETYVKLTIKADLNPMLKMMASKPIQNFLDKMIDVLEQAKFQ